MNTLFVGQHLVELNSVDSTNNYSTELVRSGIAYEGTAVWAHEQTNGRGQRGNTWLSEAEQNLTASIILFPSFITVERQFEITMCASLSVLETAENLILKKVAVKWPNDIYMDDKKCAGILIENTLSGKNISSSIIGIGINVNQKDFNGMRACSLGEFKEGLTIKDTLVMLCSILEKNYLLLKEKPQKIREHYLERLYLKNKFADYEYLGRKISAKITGVSAIGKLQLITDNDERIEADFKEIALLS